MPTFEVDESEQLKIVEENLVRKFGQAVSEERIKAEMERAVHRFDTAKVRSFVPVLVGREVTDALRRSA